MINWDPPCLLSSDTVSSMREFGLDRLCRDQDGLSELESAMFTACYWMWQGKGMDEAVEWVRRCPNPMLNDSEIEIRPVFEAEDFGDALTPELKQREEWMRRQTEAGQQ